MKILLPLSAIVASALLASSAQAVEVSSMDECLTHVENFNKSLMDNEVSPESGMEMDDTLEKVMDACEGGDFENAGTLLDKAQEQFDAISK